MSPSAGSVRSSTAPRRTTSTGVGSAADRCSFLRSAAINSALRIGFGAAATSTPAGTATPTRAGRRMVPLPQVVVQVFARRLAGRESDPQAPAVLSPRGGMLRANNWRRHTKWNTAIKQAGVAPLTIHDLRHTYASLARAAGADLRFVQRTLGHSSPVVTANIYSDLYDSELDTVATNLDRMHENNASPTGQEPDTKQNR